MCKLRKIGIPERIDYFFPAPEGWSEGKRTTTIYPASGKHAEARILSDGRLAVEFSDRHTMSGQPYYAVYESEQAYRDAAHREPHRDPEGRGGRWFPSDYSRLKVTEKRIPDANEYRGYRRENVCICGNCGKEVNYYEAKYLVSGNSPEYFPFCSDVCTARALLGNE